jgi:hypothetical protein
MTTPSACAIVGGWLYQVMLNVSDAERRGRGCHARVAHERRGKDHGMMPITIKLRGQDYMRRLLVRRASRKRWSEELKRQLDSGLLVANEPATVATSIIRAPTLDPFHERIP